MTPQIKLKEKHLEERVDLLMTWEYNGVSSDIAYPYLFRMWRQIARDGVEQVHLNDMDSPKIKALYIQLATVSNWFIKGDSENWEYEAALGKIQEYLSIGRTDESQD